jgi:hypothetical protein
MMQDLADGRTVGEAKEKHKHRLKCAMRRAVVLTAVEDRQVKGPAQQPKAEGHEVRTEARKKTQNKNKKRNQKTRENRLRIMAKIFYWYASTLDYDGEHAYEEYSRLTAHMAKEGTTADGTEKLRMAHGKERGALRVTYSAQCPPPMRNELFRTILRTAILDRLRVNPQIYPPERRPSIQFRPSDCFGRDLDNGYPCVRHTLHDQQTKGYEPTPCDSIPFPGLEGRGESYDPEECLDEYRDWSRAKSRSIHAWFDSVFNDLEHSKLGKQLLRAFFPEVDADSEEESLDDDGHQGDGPDDDQDDRDGDPDDDDDDQPPDDSSRKKDQWRSSSQSGWEDSGWWTWSKEACEHADYGDDSSQSKKPRKRAETAPEEARLPVPLCVLINTYLASCMCPALLHRVPEGGPVTYPLIGGAGAQDFLMQQSAMADACKRQRPCSFELCKLECVRRTADGCLWQTQSPWIYDDEDNPTGECISADELY